MARAKVKNINGFISSFTRSYSKKLSKNIARASKEEIKNEIIGTILSGTSPVKGKSFKQYSEKYAKAKGVPRKPVDMLLTGTMLESLEVKQVRGRPGLLIRFNSEIAEIHDKLGAGRSKIIRRLLPNSREKFKSNIQRLIDKLLKKVIRKSRR